MTSGPASGSLLRMDQRHPRSERGHPRAGRAARAGSAQPWLRRSPPARSRSTARRSPIAPGAAESASAIVLVHGGAAHARWWDHIGPLLAHDRRVVALDLSGHGDSGRREHYSLDGWAHEVLAVARAAGSTGPPIIVGHSMGGFVALRAAGLFGADLEGIVVIDSPVQDVTPEEQAAREARAFGPLRVYPTREAAIARFHPMPDQPTLPYVLEHVASTSVRAVDGGWSWKFDPAVFGRNRGSADAAASAGLPGGAVRRRARHRAAEDDRAHVRQARPASAGHRDPGGRSSRHARSAHRAGDRDPHAALGLGSFAAWPGWRRPSQRG